MATEPALKLPKFVGSYFLTWKWVEDVDDAKPDRKQINNQGIINDVVGDFAFVTYFSWLNGQANGNALVPLERFADRDSATVYSSKETFLDVIEAQETNGKL